MSVLSAARPSRVVLSTYGSFGDVHPYLAIALELQARGHEAVLATSARYREKVESRGIRFHEVRPDVPVPDSSNPAFAHLMDAQHGPERLFKELITPHLRESYDDLMKVVPDADLLVSHILTLTASALVEKTGVKWVSTVLAPLSFFSIYDPPVLSGFPGTRLLRRLGPRAAATVVKLAQRVSHSWIEPVYELRRHLGLAPGAHPLFAGMHSPRKVLGLFSPLLGPAQPDWPQQTQTTGFCFYDRQDINRDGSARDEAGLSPELEQFIHDGPAPIVFTLGSAAVFTAGDFYRDSVEAVQRIGRRAVLLVGDMGNCPPQLPASVLAVEYAPFSKLLPHAAAVVHQGGVGTTGQSMRAGKPMLVVPYSHDQPDNADRMMRLGVARTVSRHKYSSVVAALELERLLANPEYARRAATIGEQVRAENGTAHACDAIEAALVN